MADTSFNIGERLLIADDRAISDVDSFTSIGGFVNLIVFNLFIVSGVIFLFLIIFAGMSIITSDSSKGVEEGKKRLTTGIIGLIVMFSAYWIIQIVELVTGIEILF